MASLLFLFVHRSLVGVALEGVSAMLEREMVRHDWMKSVGREAKVASEKRLKVVNINRQPNRKMHM